VTIRERLRIIGQALTGNKEAPVVNIKEVVKEAKEKSVSAGFLDFRQSTLTDETKSSSKLLRANEGWVYRNNDVIAKEVGTIEFELFTVKVIGGEIVYDPILQHPLLDLLDRFNDFTSASDGFYITQSHRKLTGDSFWYLEGSGINTQSIYILPPDKVTIKLGKAQGSQRVIDGYEYQDSIKGEQININYKPEEIIHFKVPNPQNSYRGLGAVQAAAQAIDTESMANEATTKFFERGLIADFILTTEKNLTPEQLKQLHTEFRNTYGGVANAYKVPILSGGVVPNNIQMSSKEAQMLEQQEWLRDKITSIFGNNKAVLGIVEDVNRANAEATTLQWKRSTVRPEMKGICDTLNEFLVPRYGDNLLLGFVDPVEEDDTDDIDSAVKKKNAGIINLNEARGELGLDPIVGGDEFNFQREERMASQFAAGETSVPKSLIHINRKKVLRRANVYKQIEAYKKAKALVKPLAEKMISDKKKPVVKGKRPSRFTEDQVAAYHEKRLNIVNGQEKIFKEKVKTFIDQFVEKAIAKVPDEVSEMQQKQLLTEDEEKHEIAKAVALLLPIMLVLAKKSANHALALIDFEGAYTIANIEKSLTARVELFAKSMIETDKNKLVDIITEGIQNGKSIPEIRNAINATFEDYSRMQAERIARTEVLHASTESSVDAWRQTGVVEGKQWIVANPTDECAQYDGEVVTLDGSFYTETEFADGDPPLHPNCECSLIPVLFNEKAFKGSLHSPALLAKTVKEQQDYIKELEGFIDEEA
jgi:HK97 family phage portal protein